MVGSISVNYFLALWHLMDTVHNTSYRFRPIPFQAHPIFVVVLPRTSWPRLDDLPLCQRHIIRARVDCGLNRPTQVETFVNPRKFQQVCQIKVQVVLLLRRTIFYGQGGQMFLVSFLSFSLDTQPGKKSCGRMINSPRQGNSSCGFGPSDSRYGRYTCTRWLGSNTGICGSFLFIASCFPARSVKFFA